MTRHSRLGRCAVTATRDSERTLFAEADSRVRLRKPERHPACHSRTAARRLTPGVREGAEAIHEYEPGGKVGPEGM
jgi:hypothetical protein